jgi:hypothetical protein
MDQYGGVKNLEDKIQTVAPQKWQKIKAVFE